MVLTFINLLRNFSLKTYTSLEEVFEQILTIVCWNLSVTVYTASSCAKATMTIIHGRQAHGTQTFLTEGTNNLNKMRCKFTLICQILKIYFLNIFWLARV